MHDNDKLTFTRLKARMNFEILLLGGRGVQVEGTEKCIDYPSIEAPYSPYVVTSKMSKETIFIKHVLDLNIFTGTNTFEHSEFKSEKIPLGRPAVFSQTAILSSLISKQIFSLFNDTDR
jgi:hypothetical protein